LGGGEGAGTGHRLVQAEPVAEEHQRGAHACAEVGDGPVNEQLQLLLINGHEESRTSRVAADGTRCLVELGEDPTQSGTVCFSS
jgi:hypothetical protein